MTQPQTLVFTGGGTGGHIYPGIAVADELRRLDPGINLHWIGAQGRLEERLVPSAGIPLEALPVTFLKGVSPLKRALSLGRLPLQVLRAARLLKKLDARVVVSLGGFAAGPASAAAVALRIPLVLMEQNSVPGMTHRWLGTYAHTVFASLPVDQVHFGTTPVRVTGNPIRRGLLDGYTRAPLPELGQSWRILVMGGSQGARIFNENAPGWASSLRDAGFDIEWTHLCGRGNTEQTNERWQAEGLRAEVIEFSAEIVELYKRSHLVIARAGATTVAELCALGMPALYVPFAAAADNHQEANARQVADMGGAELVVEAQAREGGVVNKLRGMLGDKQALWQMGESAKKVGDPDAAALIAERLNKAMRGDLEALREGKPSRDTPGADASSEDALRDEVGRE